MTKQLLLVLEAKSLSAIEVARDLKSPLVVQWGDPFSLPCEMGTSPEALAESLKQEMLRHDVSSRSVTFVIPRNQAVLKLLSVKGTTMEELESAIKEQLEAEIPFSEEEAVWDWELADPTTILLAVVRKDRLTVVIQACRLAGLHGAEIVLSSVALMRTALSANPSYREAAIGVVHAGPQGFEMAVARRGRLVFSRGTLHAVSLPAWVEETSKSVRVYGQEHPGELLTALVVNGEEAVGLAESLERALNLPTAIGIRHPLAHGLTIPVKPKRGEKTLNLLAAMARTKEGVLAPPPGWTRVWKQAALACAVGGAVIGLILAERTLRQVEGMELEYRTLSAQVAKEPERPWLSLISQVQRALPEDVMVNALRVNDKEEVTIEFTAESFSGITLFYNRLARSPVLTGPQLGTIRTVTDRNRQLHRSVVKARLL